jgi:glycosyltransferase involved in cell wall biosynthesis
MHILMLLCVTARKGAYWRALHLARCLVQRGHHVTLLAISPQNRFRFHSHQDQGVTIIETPDLLSGPLRSGWDVWDVLRRIVWLNGRSSTFHLIHMFDARPVSLLPALYLQKVHHIPLIMDWEDWFGRGGSVEERPNPLIRAILRPVETFFEERFRTHADATTVICHTLRQKAMALGVSAHTIRLVRDGCDTEGLQPFSQHQARQHLNLPLEAVFIGYVGAIFHRDAQLMAHAFNLIQAQLPTARLLLIGYVNINIEALVHEPTAVLRTGFINYQQLNQYLCACDICLLPYYNSGANRGRWPMKLNDYMAAGCPTVATAVGDVAQVMQEHAIGLLTEDTAEAIAAGALTLLRDVDQRTHFGQNARRVAEQQFNWQIQTDKVEQLYAQVVAQTIGYWP